MVPSVVVAVAIVGWQDWIAGGVGENASLQCVRGTFPENFLANMSYEMSRKLQGLKLHYPIFFQIFEPVGTTIPMEPEFQLIVASYVVVMFKYNVEVPNY